MMALLYRVVAFGKPQGPWRSKKRQAQQDAVSCALGEYDEWGQFWLEGQAAIEWRREEEVRLCA